MQFRRTNTAVRALIRWGRVNGREFPWRTTDSAYLLSLAEVLLRKTRAEAVTAVYKQLIHYYPTPHELLVAPDVELSGIVGHLGLPIERLRQLRIVAVHFATTERSGPPPLGPYATSAVSLSQGGFGAPVDGNIARLMGRVLGLRLDRGELRKNRAVQSAVSKLFDVAVHRGLGREAFHALLDVAASHCTRSKPSCSTCPLKPQCHWAKENHSVPRRSRSEARSRARVEKSLERSPPVNPWRLSGHRLLP